MTNPAHIPAATAVRRGAPLRGKGSVNRAPRGGSRGSLALLFFASVILIPTGLSHIHLSPISILLSMPVIMVLWAVSIPLAALAIAYFADRQCPRRRPLSYVQPLQLHLTHYVPVQALDRKPLHPGSDHVSRIASSLIDLVMRDFVFKWHTPLASGPPTLALPSDSQLTSFDRPGLQATFADATECTIRSAMERLIERSRSLDLATLGVRKILPVLTQHLEALRAAEEDLGGRSGLAGQSRRDQGSRSTKGVHDAAFHTLGETEATDLFLASRYKGGELHPAVRNMSTPNTRPAELDHLRGLSTRITSALLPSSARASSAVFVVVRELIGCTILMPIVELLSDPHFWNDLIDEKAGREIKQQHLITRLREELDKQGMHAPPSAPESSSNVPQSASIQRAHQSFDQFLANISKADSILEAKRAKNEIAVQLRKTKAALSESSSSGADPEIVARRNNLIRYLEQLHLAHTASQKRVDELSTNLGGHDQRHQGASESVSYGSKSATLLQVLLNPSTLSYWMEYMDRRRRSTHVQFWLAVESFKDPLESVESEAEAADEGLHSSSSSTTASAVSTLKEDLRLFESAYYSNADLAIRSAYVQTAQNFLTRAESSFPSPREVHIVRRSVLRAQRQIYKDMLEDDWPPFTETDLYFRVVDDLARDSSNGDGTEEMGRLHQTRRESPGNAIADSTSPRLPLKSPLLSRTASSHADLFGVSRPPTPSGLQLFDQDDARDLFGDKPSPDSTIRNGAFHSAKIHDPSTSDKFHYLVSTKAGTTKGGERDLRAPLFGNNALFSEGDDEEDAKDETERSVEAIGAKTDAAFLKVEIEMLDAVVSILEDEDRPQASRSVSTDESASRHGRKTRASTAASELRPAFRKVDSARVALQREKRKVRLDDLDWGADSELEGKTLTSTPEDDSSDTNRKDHQIASDLTPAVPGDTNLPLEIMRVRQKLARIAAQPEILDALLRKAELTGAREKELNLLRKSRGVVEREVRELKWQLDQLMSREDGTRVVFGRTRLRVLKTAIGTETDGKEYALYLVEVANLLPNSANLNNINASGNGWVVGRRYSEFWALHQRLKERFAPVRALESDFPGRRLVGLVSASFVDARRIAFDHYLTALVSIKEVCDAPELRAFLSPSNAVISAEMLEAAYLSAMQIASAAGNVPLRSKHGSSASASTAEMTIGAGASGLVRTFMRGVTGVAEGLDDLIFGQSMFEVVVQRLSSGAINSTAAGLLSNVLDVRFVSQAMQVDATAAELDEAAAAGTTYFSEPICDLAIELFELKENNNWLRRQAIVIILQQLLGGTIERKIRDAVAAAVAPDRLVGYLDALRNGMWPDGQLKEPGPPRTPSEKAQIRESANRKLSALIPDLAANFIGRQNARRGARRLFSLFQNRRLNKHLIYTILDDMVNQLFPLPGQKVVVP